MIDLDQKIEKKCPHCGGSAFISYGAYADDFVMVVCDECDSHTDSEMLGEHHEGAIKVLKYWDDGLVNQYTIKEKPPHT